jgi:hypothetical protein
MRNTTILICIVMSVKASAAEDTNKLNLPPNALVIEVESLESKGHPNRKLVLWMIKPSRNPSGAQEDSNYPYSCPEETRGSHYTGPTRVSLYDTKSQEIINTVEVRPGYQDADDSFDIPFGIRKGYHYKVESESLHNAETKPHIMFLDDYNGDGKKLEFPLFDALACMGLMTTLIGYSEQQDRVVRYQIRLSFQSEHGSRVEVEYWCDYLFDTKPEAPGHWSYQVDYTGRGGCVDKYDIRYNPETEVFEGSCSSTSCASGK